MTTHRDRETLNLGKGPRLTGMQGSMERPERGTCARIARALFLVFATGALCAASVIAAPIQKPPASQTLFATPEAAVQALAAAAKAADQTEMAAVLGPEQKKLLSGDPVADASALTRLSDNLEKSATLEKVDDSKYTVVVGEEHWPLPIPIVKEGAGWRFDTAAGLDEILNRRIGQNELSAIMTSRAYVLAQWQYYTEARDTAKDGLAVYAQKFISTPGQRNGLFWEVPEGATPSPMGDLVEQARAEGYAAGRAKNTHAPKRSPYHGYVFRILKAQGAHAPGGKFSYVINGNMIAGFALIAYPATWGNSGVMTFIVNQQGRVYEKDLGPRTAELAAAITDYDPDVTWKLVDEP